MPTTYLLYENETKEFSPSHTHTHGQSRVRNEDLIVSTRVLLTRGPKNQWNLKSHYWNSPVAPYLSPSILNSLCLELDVLVKLRVTTLITSRMAKSMGIYISQQTGDVWRKEKGIVGNKDSLQRYSFECARPHNNGWKFQKSICWNSVKWKGLPYPVAGSHYFSYFSRDWMILAPDSFTDILRHCERSCKYWGNSRFRTQLFTATRSG